MAFITLSLVAYSSSTTHISKPIGFPSIILPAYELSNQIHWQSLDFIYMLWAHLIVKAKNSESTSFNIATFHNPAVVPQWERTIDISMIEQMKRYSQRKRGWQNVPPSILSRLVSFNKFQQAINISVFIATSKEQVEKFCQSSSWNPLKILNPQKKLYWNS